MMRIIRDDDSIFGIRNLAHGTSCQTPCWLTQRTFHPALSARPIPQQFCFTDSTPSRKDGNPAIRVVQEFVKFGKPGLPATQCLVEIEQGSGLARMLGRCLRRIKRLRTFGRNPSL